MDTFFAGTKNLMSCLAGWLELLFSFSPGQVSFWLFLACFLILLFSGLLGAEKAEERGYNPKIHFILSILIPFLYPCLLVFILKPRQGCAIDRAQFKQKKTEAAQVEEAVIPEEEEEEEYEPGVWTGSRLKRYLAELREQGLPEGPFRCVLKDSGSMEVIRFDNFLPNAAVCVIMSGSDEVTLRIPYEKIDSVEHTDKISSSSSYSGEKPEETEQTVVMSEGAEPDRIALRHNGDGDLAPGEVFEKYTVKKLLGKGGMGAVYLVNHNMLATSFALKVLYPKRALTDKNFVERFIREARLSCRIRHPNLIAVHDAGQEPKTGLYYIVMDYVEGQNIGAILKNEGAFSPEQALPVIRQTALAIQEAQRNNLVHRDIKPDNIMLAPDGCVKLADLGIAKTCDAKETGLTLASDIFGTPAYMAPEQARNSKDVDCRADIYSLGIVLFEMLAAKRVYPGENVIEILTKVISDEEIPDVRTLCPQVSGGVAALIRDMTWKNRDQRIASPDELLERIRFLELN